MSDEANGTGTTDLVYVPDWSERARKSLLSQDWDKKRIVALAEAIGCGTQALEDCAFDVLMSTQLDTAVGVQLDLIGETVGESRGALADEDYRRFVRARILVNICQGTPDELIAIFALITAPSTVQYLPMWPAGYTLQCVRKGWLAEVLRRRVRRIMEAARPAGVVSELIEALPGPFGFTGNELGGVGYDRGLLARVL